MIVAFTIADFYVNINGFVTIGQTFLTCSLPLSALWASVESEKNSVVQVKPSGPFGSITCTEGTQGQPTFKKSVISFFSGRKWAATSSIHSDTEKGSFAEDRDHVTTSESRVPQFPSSGGYRF